LVEQGPKQGIFDDPQHAHTKSLLDAAIGQERKAGGDPDTTWKAPLSAKALLRLQVMSKVAPGP